MEADIQRSVAPATRLFLRGLDEWRQLGAAARQICAAPALCGGSAELDLRPWRNDWRAFQLPYLRRRRRLSRDRRRQCGIAGRRLCPRYEQRNVPHRQDLSGRELERKSAFATDRAWGIGQGR